MYNMQDVKLQKRDEPLSQMQCCKKVFVTRKLFRSSN